jgi:L-rhamnose mutarotase
MSSVIIKEISRPSFPTSTTNATRLGVAGSSYSIANTVPNIIYSEWQLFGGSNIMQTIANDAIVGMWWDQQIAANPTDTTVWEKILKVYYMYDGFVLLHNA